ncbi:MAG: bifunctional prephenate dehydrogenase/3-phosphoshikimate 1-carboxyvinyltransferase [Gammaproteobacteria bacterium]|nr:bifunctional prephenate dehydrogenase/3-phosphoshikimate 1-carboxyvinyltransferase [Gammaproteobacteria bacterium]
MLIVGLGLIGGSIARGLKRANPDQPITAVDTDTEALAEASAQAVIDRSGTLAELAAAADIVILALPPVTTVAMIPEIAACVRQNAVVTDVASVKSAILESVNKLEPEFVARFVPGHPIAGSEKSGFSASRANLFSDRNVILTPQSDTNPEAVALVNELWRELGCSVLGMNLDRHDAVLAATSHLPHLLAYALVDALVNQEQSEDIFRYAAGGFADFSRLVSSDAKMWSDIFVSNSGAIIHVLDTYIQNLHKLRELIDHQEHARLMKLFSEAKSARDNFLKCYFESSDAMAIEERDTQFVVEPGGLICGNLRVPGDKSISHRSVILGSIANGVTRVRGFLEGEDAINTVAAFREMGVTIIGPENGELTIFGVGKHGLKAPRNPLYLGNSGTSMRLLTGLLAAQSFESELTGDESLSARPMQRVAGPLQEMGAVIDTDSEGRPPLRIRGASLKGIDYAMPMASAQVKSCLLLAGLYAEGETAVSEPAVCRDHTERMLSGFGYSLHSDDKRRRISLTGGQMLTAIDIDIPADISSAAFLMVAAAISPGSSLCLQHVGVNPTRSGIINILRAMGADIDLSNEREVGGELVADLAIHYRPLHGIVIPEDQIPLAIDEFPAIFIAASCAEGETLLRGAAELRVKESDRIEAMATGLTTLGIESETFEDGIRITGGQLSGGEVDSRGDHRIAMAFTIAGLQAAATITVNNCANVATSFPGFVDLTRQAGLRLTERAVS